ncbi:MAG: type VI secretion system needle protein Hcp [Bacteroides sp.]|nr:type VI secretion system needle protein Hcp [Bacteroides sp.]
MADTLKNTAITAATNAVANSTIAGKVKEATSGLFNFAQVDSNLEVWFVFEGKEYELAQFHISFGQAVDFKGQPQDEVRGGQILLTLTEAVPDNIYKWAMTSCLKDGSIEFRSKTSNAPLKVEFSNGFCINFNRIVDAGGGLNTALAISSEEININGLRLDNHWV